MLTSEQRIERYKQGLENAKQRLANSTRPDWIAYNKRRIAKYEKLLSEPLKPMGQPIGSPSMRLFTARYLASLPKK